MKMEQCSDFTSLIAPFTDTQPFTLLGRDVPHQCLEEFISNMSKLPLYKSLNTHYTCYIPRYIPVSVKFMSGERERW